MGTLWTAGQEMTTAMLNQYYAFADTTSTTVTAASPTRLTTSYSIAAGVSNVGDAYEILFGGTGTWGSTQQLIAFTLSIGGVTILSNSNGIAAAAFSANASIRFSGRAQWVFNAIGASGNVFGSYSITVSEVANANNPGTASTNTMAIADANASASSSVDTTSAMACFVTAGWGGTAGSPTISCKHTIFAKVA